MPSLTRSLSDKLLFKQFQKESLKRVRAFTFKRKAIRGIDKIISQPTSYEFRTPEDILQNLQMRKNLQLRKLTDDLNLSNYKTDKNWVSGLRKKPKTIKKVPSPAELRQELEHSKRASNNSKYSKFDTEIPNSVLRKNKKSAMSLNSSLINQSKRKLTPGRRNIFKHLTMEKLNFKYVKKPTKSVTPKFSLEKADIISRSESIISKEGQLFKKIQKMVLPKLRLENAIYRPRKRKPHPKFQGEQTKQGCATPKKNDTVSILEKFSDEVSLQHELETLKSLKKQAEKASNQENSPVSALDSPSGPSKKLDENFNGTQNSADSSNFAKTMAGKLEKELLRSKTVRFLRFGNAKLLTKWEKELNREVILRSRTKFSEVVLDRGWLKEVDLTRFRKLKHTRYNKYL